MTPSQMLSIAKVLRNQADKLEKAAGKKPKKKAAPSFKVKQGKKTDMRFMGPYGSIKRRAYEAKDAGDTEKYKKLMAEYRKRKNGHAEKKKLSVGA